MQEGQLGRNKVETKNTYHDIVMVIDIDVDIGIVMLGSISI